MSDIERKSNILISLNNEYVKTFMAEPESAEQRLHYNECHRLIDLAIELYGYEFVGFCLDFLEKVDDAIALWKERNAK